jgi:hypothetical protein
MELLVTRLVQVRAPRGFCSSTWPTLQHAEGCGMLTHTCGLNVHEQKDMAIGGLFRFCMDSPRPHQRPRVPASDEETGHHAGR